MTQQPVNPFVLRDVLCRIDADDFEKHVSNVTITPSGGTVNWQGLEPAATFVAPTTPTWQVALTYAQDWNSATSLSRYLYVHEGETVTMLFEPIKGGVGFQVDVIITPGAIGGDVNTVATATVTLGATGRPTLVQPAAAG